MVEDYREKDPSIFAAYYERSVSWNSAEFKKFLKAAEKDRLDWRPGPNRTSLSHYVLVQDGPILAKGRLRFPLDKKTEIDGRKHRSRRASILAWTGESEAILLSLMLFEAVRAGLRRALVTCLAQDPAARRVIEKNRGQLFDMVESTRTGRRGEEIARYWIDFR